MIAEHQIAHIEIGAQLLNRSPVDMVYQQRLVWERLAKPVAVFCP